MGTSRENQSKSAKLLEVVSELTIYNKGIKKIYNT